MNIERELLTKAVEWMHELKYVLLEERDCGDTVLLDLIADLNKIEKFLAQPEQTEQTEQKPVAWMWTNEELGRTYFSDIENPNWIPLYAAPPKREPLSGDEIKALYDRHAFAMESDEYMWGFRDAEKAHGIREKGDV